MNETIGTASPETIDWLKLCVTLFGGLGLFLFGLEQMTSALKQVAGDRLRLLISQLTTNRVAGMATGAFVTSVIQSSSVTTVLVVSFISSGAMTLAQSVGVILGANIGTTITAQIVAFKVTGLAYGLVGLGFATSFIARSEPLRQHGSGMLGLGLVFLGMTVMSESMEPLRGYPPFLDAMARIQHPLVGIALSAGFTALVQSSSATTAVVISMATQGLITLPAGIALILGANVGTCITALLASLGKPREAVRAAWVHVLFNLLGVALWFSWVDELARFAALASPTAEGLVGLEKLAAETPRQIANAHTLFNIANGVLFLPFTTLLAWTAERLVREVPAEAERRAPVEFLDTSLLTAPALALEQARWEIGHLGTLVLEMLIAVLPAMTRGDARALDRIHAMDEPVDRLYEQVVEYLGQINRADLSSREAKRLMNLMEIANALESIGDLIENDLVERGRQRASADLRISEGTLEILTAFHGEIESALHDVLEALDQEDRELARQVSGRKSRVASLAKDAGIHGANRLIAEESGRLTAYGIEMDMIEDLRRVFYFTRRVAKAVVKLTKHTRGT